MSTALSPDLTMRYSRKSPEANVTNVRNLLLVSYLSRPVETPISIFQAFFEKML